MRCGGDFRGCTRVCTTRNSASSGGSSSRSRGRSRGRGSSSRSNIPQQFIPRPLFHRLWSHKPIHARPGAREHSALALPSRPYSPLPFHQQNYLRSLRQPTSTHISLLPTTTTTSLRMSSTTPESTSVWSAQKVRDTFLKYFEDKEHTFGKSALPQNTTELTHSLTFSPSQVLTGSTFIRSHSALHQCWYEPVQTYLSRNRRSYL